MRKILIALLCLIPMVNAVAQGSKPVDGFFKVCMGSLGNQDKGEQIARRLGLMPANEEQRKTLLRHGSAGRVYVEDKLAIVLEQNGLCTVFAYADDRGAVQDELKKSLPHPSTPFTVSEEALGRHTNVTGTVYHLALPTGPFADWIFSSYHQPQPGKYNVAISLQIRRKE